MNVTQETIFLTRRGMKELKKTITKLEQERLRVVQGLRGADKTTDHDARLERIERLSSLESVEAELFEKKTIFERAKLLPSKRARLEVAIGSIVDLIDSSGRVLRYTLVDSFEADPSEGKISIVSPLGKNLIGKTVQDIVVWSSGIRTTSLQVVRIS